MSEFRTFEELECWKAGRGLVETHVKFTNGSIRYLEAEKSTNSK